MIDCAQCGSTSIWVDDAFRTAGEQGAFHDGAGLIALGKSFLLRSRRYAAIGHCQFDYGAGVWDEFWCVDEQELGVWCSVDEGDYALERPAKLRNGQYVLGDTVKIEGRKYRATEKDVARCTAFRGELPEVLALGDTHEYVDFSGPGRRMATLEHWSGGHSWTVGEWFSAWDIQPL